MEHLSSDRAVSGDGDRQPMLQKSVDYGTSGTIRANKIPHDANKKPGITVQPIMLLYQLGISSLRTTTEQFAYAKFLAQWTPNNSGNATDDVGDSCGDVILQQELDAQAQTARFLVAYDLALLLPGILLALCLGSYSDRYGRKMLLLCPLLGIVARALCSFLVADFNWNVYTLFVGVIFDALSGGQCVFSTTVYAYIADISGRGTRSYHIFGLQTVGFVGQIIAQLTVGYLIQYMGWSPPFLVITGLLICTFPVLCCVPESTMDATREPPLSRDAAGGTTKRGYVRRTLQVLRRPTENETLIVRVCLVVVLLVFMSKEGVIGTVILYFLKSPICLNALYIAYVGCSLWTLGSLLTMVALYILGRLRATHVTNMIIGMTWACLSKIWLLLPFSGLVVAFGYTAVAALGFMLMCESRSFLSKLVSSEEQGAISACVTIVSLVGVTSGNFIFTAIYGTTVALYDGSAFVTAACVDMTGIGLLVYITYLTKRAGTSSWTYTAVIPAAGNDGEVPV